MRCFNPTCTIRLLCVLTDQALEMGDTVFFSELWVERMMQLVKQAAKYKARSKPEEVISIFNSSSHEIQSVGSAGGLHSKL